MVVSTLWIGGLQKAELLLALHERGVHLNEAAEALFADARFTTPVERRLVDLVVISVDELGFGEGATYDELIARALEFRWVECPLGLGPHLRLQFLDQPEASSGVAPTEHRAPAGSITVASTPLDSSEDTPRGFYLRRIDGVLWLRGYRSWPGHVWSPGDVFVFSGLPVGHFRQSAP